MKKIIEIKGMSCSHCEARANKALNAIEGVEAKVNLKKNNAVLTLDREVDEKVIADALEEVALELVSISDKKGLFG